jgi:RHS repeat-associated protein
MTLRRVLSVLVIVAFLSSCTSSSTPGSPLRQTALRPAGLGEPLAPSPGGAADPLVPTDTANGLAVGRTVGTGGVTNDGAAQYTLPLWVPPGRAGLQPDLSLLYSSRGPNGLLGMGWSLGGFPRITRCRRTFAQDGGARQVDFVDGDQGDRFCLDGQRLVAVGGTDGPGSVYGADGTEYRTEQDMHAKIVSYAPDALGPSYFRVYLKDGRILTLGGGGSGLDKFEGQRAHVSGASWLVDYSQSVRYAWGISRMEDRAGNYLTVKYGVTVFPNFGYEQLPQSIEYTASSRDPSVAASRSIEFLYENRPDPSVAFVSGLRLQQTRRLQRVEMRWHPDANTSTLLRSYRLQYRNDSASKRSLLSQVQECDGADVCKPPTRFGWSLGLDDSFSEVGTKLAVNVDRDSQSEIGDLDGDGRDDISLRSSLTPGGAKCQLPAPSGSVGCAGLPFNPFHVGDPGGPGDGLPQPAARVIDLNGDDRADTIFLERARYDSPRDFKNVISWNLAPGQPAPPTDTVEKYSSDTRTRYALDMNGDGLPELVTEDGAYRLNVNGVLGDYVGNPLPTGNPHTEKIFAVDIDGSGRTSLLTSDGALSIDNGTARTEQTTITGGTGSFPGHTGESFSNFIFLDVNGDGLTDWVSGGETRGYLNVSLNTGHGFAKPERWTIPAPYDTSPSVDPESHPPFLNGERTDFGERVIDFNGDGRQDLLLMAGYPEQSAPAGATPPAPRKLVVLLSTGTGFEVHPLPITAGTGDFAITASDHNPHVGWTMSQTLDANGDGLEDFIQPVNGTLHLYLRQGEKGDLLTDVVDGQGATEGFQYRPVSSPDVYAAGSGCTYPVTCVTRNLWLVLRHEIHAADTPSHMSLRYHYQDGRSDLPGRRWLGFGRRSETDEVTGRTTTAIFDNQTRTGSLYPCLDVAKAETTDVPLDGGVLHRNTELVHCQVLTENNGQVYYAYPDVRELAESENTDGGPFTLLRRSHVSQTEDIFGNVTNREILTYAVQDGELTGRPHQLQVTDTYDNFEASWLIGQSKQDQEISTTRSGRSVTRTVAYEHDPDTGLLTKTTTEPEAGNTPEPAGSGVFLETILSLDRYGLVTAVESVGSGQARLNRFEYDDTDHIFPKSTTDAAGHTSHFTYHQGLGVLTGATDANGLQTLYQYDGFGRPRLIDLPDKPDVAWHYNADASGRLMIIMRPTSGVASDIYLDRLGRERARQWQSFGGSPVDTETTYNDAGRLASVSYPHAPASPPRLQQFHYDNLGRLLSTTNPDGTERTRQYQGLKTSYGNEKGNQHYVVEDELGRVAVSADVGAIGHEIRTSFRYGPFNVEESVTDAYGHQTAIGYDKVGRPSTLNDPDSGTHVTHYNAFGEVKDETDGNGDRTAYERDPLGRIQKVTTKDGVTTLIWDTAAHGVGMLAASHSPDGVDTTHSYDQLSRPSRTVSVVDGTPYALDYTYDALGRLATLTYPAVAGRPRLAVQYRYTPRGELQSVQDASGQHAYWTVQVRNPSGQLTAESFGNGVATTRQYDDRGWLRTVDTKAATGKPLQSLEFTYEPNGNLSGRIDHLASSAETFSYDPLERLTEWTAAQTPHTNTGITYSYDDVGNLLNQAVIGHSAASVAYTYGGQGAGPHAVTKTTSGTTISAYTYDPAGNQHTAAGRTVDYTAFSLPKRIQQAGLDTIFKYDALHDRVVKRAANGASTVYVHGFYEKRTTPGATVHAFNIQGADRTVAQVLWTKSGSVFSADRTLYLHDDNLRSPETVSDPNGKISENLKYDPFGGRRSYQDLGSPPAQPPKDVRLGFTGQQEDDEFNLINMKGRIYDPILGRFLSADPLVTDPLSGQAYNHYSYVLNNPLTLTDPTGFDDEDDRGTEFTFPYSLITGQCPGCGSSSSTAPPITPGASCSGICGGGPSDQNITTGPRATDDNGPVRQQNPRQIPNLTITAAPPASGMASLANPIPSAPAGPAPATPTALSGSGGGNLHNSVKDDLRDLILTRIDPWRHGLRGSQISAGGSLCVGFCTGVFNVAAGFVLTPVGPNDWFFGEADVFVTFGGSLLGVSVGPKEGNLPSKLGPIGPDLYPSLGLSVGAGVEVDWFASNEVLTIEGFGAWSRNVGVGVGPFTVSESENSAGKVYGFGVGISSKGFGGGNVYNSYTIPWRVW